MSARRKRGLWTYGCAVVCAGIVLAGGLVQPVAADLVTFDFAGEVSFIDSRLSPPFTTGAPIVGSFTYETATPPYSPTQPHTAEYLYALTELNFTFGTYEGSLGTAWNAVSLYDDVPSGSNYIDGFSVSATSPGSLSGSPVPSRFVLGLQAYGTGSQDLVTGLGLPTTAPDFSKATDINLSLGFSSNSGDTFYILGNLTSLTADTAPVPEPTTLLVVAPWVAWLGAMAWRRNRVSRGK